MGDSLPPPATFDLVDSFARRRDPKTELIEANAVVRLKYGKRSVDAAGQLVQSPAGRRLTVRAPRNQFVNGIWSMSVQTEADGFVPLAARLLVQGDRPLVLLWGATPGRTVLPPVRAVPVTPKQRAAAVGGRALDSVLSVLPDEKASVVRKKARQAARRVLS
jgi:hypothetical protein